MSQDPNYSRLKNRLIASTGLAFYADREQLLAVLIGERLSALRPPDCASYTAFLADGGAEMDVLLALLTKPAQPGARGELAATGQAETGSS